VGSCEHGIELSDLFKLGKYFISSFAVNSQIKTAVHKYTLRAGSLLVKYLAYYYWCLLSEVQACDHPQRIFI